MSTLTDEIARRRTFAIISHPDAGKTTLTEKLLLFGGAIQLAGEVKARGERRRVRSDWMAIERERGISVSSAVMSFEHEGLAFNLLDTPGHQDFSEDTYRTLTAVDSAVMVLDAAKGIEEQTRKLFEVCRLRDVPIITFVNKLDREGRDPFDLLDEIEQSLALDVTPASLADRHGARLSRHLGSLRRCAVAVRARRSTTGSSSRSGAAASTTRTCSRRLPRACARQIARGGRDGARPLSALRSAGLSRGPSDSGVLWQCAQQFRGARIVARDRRTGSAAAAATGRPDRARSAPEEPEVAGFVFKVQANIDPQHRDRIAFVRISSGRFQRGMKLKNIRTGRVMSVQAPVFFLARERNLAEEAWPGDIIGIPNHGSLRIGDTLTEGEAIRVTGIPNFAPEILQRVRVDDPMKSKHLRHALEQLAEEGVTRVFKPARRRRLDRRRRRRAAARRARRRGSPPSTTSPPASTARPFRRRAGSKPTTRPSSNASASRTPSASAEDHDGVPVFLARNAWDLAHHDRGMALVALQGNPRAELTEIRENRVTERLAGSDPCRCGPRPVTEWRAVGSRAPLHHESWLNSTLSPARPA